jgi:hypothetical protein
LKIKASGEPPNVAYKIQNDHAGFVFAKAKAAAQLLHEDTAAVCNALKNNDVYIGDIDTFVQNINSTQYLRSTVVKIAKDSASFSG